MVRIIDTEEGAKRLARVILSDIEIYNRQKVRSQADLEPQLEEGYALFRSRVAPALAPVFREVVADRWSEAPVKPAPMQPAAPRPAAQTARRESLDPREAARRLARVMAANIQSGARPDGAGLAADIAEARAQFQSCVVPELASLFDEALAELALLEQEPPPPRPAPQPAPPLQVSSYESTQAVPIEVEPGEQTERTMPADGLFDEPPPLPIADASPARDETPRNIPAPAPSSPVLPARREWNPSKAWLALAAVAVALATASIVYLLLSR